MQLIHLFWNFRRPRAWNSDGRSGLSIRKVTRKELKAINILRLNKDIRILQTDKGNCTVMWDESKYKVKLTTFLDSKVY